MTTKLEIVQRIIGGRPKQPKDKGHAFAPTNIALCKYWGKRDEELNLPLTSSLSVSLGSVGAETSVSLRYDKDTFNVNGEEIPAASDMAIRLTRYLDLFRPEPGVKFAVDTKSGVPIAAGLASSASGFAALALALNDLFHWQLNATATSILARLGSGSACRSIYPGFVEWQAGRDPAGMDSFAVPFPHPWPEFRIGLLVLAKGRKPMGSTAAMRHTRETSRLYTAWPTRVEEDLATIKTAIQKQHFALLGQTAEGNALAMHATMMDSRPAIMYFLPETIETIQRVWTLRKTGLEVYLTVDAGPNVKLIFLADKTEQVRESFPNLQIIAPFK